MFRTKCPSLRLSAPPPARCTMYASKMMARITTTSQKKNTTTPGMAYPDIVLALAMATRYPPPPEVMRRASGCARDGIGPRANLRRTARDALLWRGAAPPDLHLGELQMQVLCASS